MKLVPIGQDLALVAEVGSEDGVVDLPSGRNRRDAERLWAVQIIEQHLLHSLPSLDHHITSARKTG